MCAVSQPERVHPAFDVVGQRPGVQEERASRRRRCGRAWSARRPRSGRSQQSAAQRFFHTFCDIMNGCSKSIGSPEPRCIGARSVMLPDTKGDTGGTARRSATVCPRDRQHHQRQRHPRRDQAAVVGEPRPAAVARRDDGRCGVPAGDAGRRRPTRRRAGPALSDGWYLASAGGDLKGRNGVAVLSRHPIKSVRDLGAGGGTPSFATSSRFTAAMWRSTSTG